MAYSLTQFENNLQNSLVALDNNILTLSAAAPISCNVAGTNTLTLTQNGVGEVPSSPITAYTTNMSFSGIASGTNTGPVTAQVGSVGIVSVYKDGAGGPVALTGSEIVLGNAFTLRFDAALNSGAGGFHLISNTASSGTAIAPTSVQVNGNSTLTNLLSGNSPTLTFTATPGWLSQDQTFSVTAALASALPAVGDFMLVNPPSLGAAGVDFRGFVTSAGVLSVSLASASFSNVSVTTVNIRLLNAASASLASNSGIYRYAALRSVP
jgi:hypothetical protein